MQACLLPRPFKSLVNQLLLPSPSHRGDFFPLLATPSFTFCRVGDKRKRECLDRAKKVYARAPGKKYRWEAVLRERGLCKATIRVGMPKFCRKMEVELIREVRSPFVMHAIEQRVRGGGLFTPLASQFYRGRGARGKAGR